MHTTFQYPDLSTMRPDDYAVFYCVAPTRETLWARCMRWLSERRQLAHLQEMDEHMLRDVGLTREDVIRRMPFKRPRDFHF
jgi:uncharacterized protein YjiS (DUF1127 family)